MSETKDFKIERGATWNVELTSTNDNDSPADFTGLTSAEIQIRNELKDVSTVKLLNLTSGITKALNVLTIALTPRETAALTRDHYHYKLVMQFGSDVYIPITESSS